MHEQISHSFTGMEELFMTMNAINSVNSTTNSYQTSTASKTASTSTDKTTTSDKAESRVSYMRNLLKQTRIPLPKKLTMQWLQN